MQKRHNVTAERIPAVGQVVSTTMIVNMLVAIMLFASSFHAAAAEKAIHIAAFGDSLTSGYGVRPADAFPVQLQKHLKAQGHNVTVSNGGVAGDTTAAGLARIDWTIGDDVDAVIVELGANDALRGIDPKVTRENLQKILSALAGRNLPVLLTGMRSPANWGETYSDDFDAIFPELAKEHSLLFYPFFLDGVILDVKLNQKDGMHPNAKGVAEIVRRITPSVEELIGKVKAQRAAEKS
ncbi:arylesterase [Hyphomicrobium sp. D-2]|uniref:arylesterase n=1 Tax=Hyphomicrobium sp. D-2 TaxID=3041621 RepID=UPI0024547A33|nr:arylesterase [Hyphomicrobium sp. D-2]MDH4983378.1 arylesterase [Hyphomicrobium sp. D-2]